MIKYAKGCLGQEELKEVEEAFNYGYFGLAYKVTEFESKIQEYLKTDRYVIATNTGTTALHLVLDSLGIGPGDEVILPSFTFVATAQAITACGATPVFCDINESTLLMDIEDVKKKISNKTKAIIPVHYSGQPCDMDQLLEIKQKYNIRIIEDAAHAIGSKYKNQNIGSFGDITCFSFDSIKVITCGEGGAIVTEDKALAELCKEKRLLGIDRKTMHQTDWKKRSWQYDVKVQGYRYHMSNINAAIGVAQLRKIDEFIKHRVSLCNRYDSLLKDIDGIELIKVNYSEIAPFMYVIKVKDNKRNDLKDFLQSKEIETGISYIPCHTFSFYKDNVNTFPVTEKVFEEILCLPLHFDVSINDVDLIVNFIIDFFKRMES